MATSLEPYAIRFPEWYDDRAEFEATSKGYLGEVVVRLADGSRYQLYFIDPVRLGQDLDAEVQSGRNCLAEPALVVLPEVTTEAVRKAVPELIQSGYFRHLKPLA
jgi:hypothetical protein